MKVINKPGGLKGGYSQATDICSFAIDKGKINEEISHRI